MIELIVLACAPAFVAIVGIITACAKVWKGFKELKGEVINTKEYQDVKAQLKIAHQENIELKKLIKELLTKVDHIKREEE